MKSHFLLAILIAFPLLVFSQVYTGRQASEKISGAEKLILSEESGRVKLLTFSEGVKNIDPANAAQWMTKILKIRNGSFALDSRSTDQLGVEHFKYRQAVNGIPVENTAITLHVKNGEIVSLSGEYYENIQLQNTTPTISTTRALELAKEWTNAAVYRDQNKLDATELVVVEVSEDYRLAFKVDVYASVPLSRKDVFVDATTGEVLKTNNILQDTEAEGIAETIYSGDRAIVTDSVSADTFRLRDYSRGGGIVTLNLEGSAFLDGASDVVDDDNHWDFQNHDYYGELDAHWGAEMTYDYFLEHHNRNSFDDAGATISVYVGYGFFLSNAFWDGEHLIFGSGPIFNGTPYTALDIVAHEFTHGVTQHTAGLIYENESGALNESFSDIFGISVDFYADENGANFIIGEQVATPPIRSMEDPKMYGDPDTYLGEYWVSGPEDNGGVHTNSGVQNYWFYLISEGGYGVNDNGDAYTVNGIGIEAAAQIAYRTLSVYLTPGSNHQDARLYSIQAATDLFGECSDEVLAVTNAWYAVGVGEQSTEMLLAYFDQSTTFNCMIPTTVEFNNVSTSNTNSWYWDFGDGNFSSEEHPVHTYTSPGTYTVTLIANGVASCGNSDTLVVADLITITDDYNSITPACEPPTAYPDEGEGIEYFSLEAYEWSSGPSTFGYENFFCEEIFFLESGAYHSLSVETYSEEYVSLWIDLNNDGAFNASEHVYSSTEAATEHLAEIIVPETSLPDSPLRLRVGSSTEPINSACSPPDNGQVEDYLVYISANQNGPIVNFESSNTYPLEGETVSFTDLTQYFPTSWLWSFPGGTPSTSTEQFPDVTYDEAGTYDVSLVVSNEFGADSLTLEEYITVTESLIMCQNTVTTSLTGEFYDPSGPTGVISGEGTCTMLINPCGGELTLTFETFDLPTCCNNSLEVYDGQSVDYSTQVLDADGSQLPDPITSESGSFFIVFDYDSDSQGYLGWSATYTSELSENELSADFTVSEQNPAYGEAVQFEDNSTGSPESWFWDFGDGSTSEQQSPSHAFLNPGVHDVSLTVSNCAGDDIATQQIEVQGTPDPTISIPDNLYLQLLCGEGLDTSFTIYNEGTGDMVLELSHESYDLINYDILFLMDEQEPTNFDNVLEAIDVAATNLNYHEYYWPDYFSEDIEDFEDHLFNKDIVIIPTSIGFDGNVIYDVSEKIFDFVEDGGGLIMCAGDDIASSGFFDYDFYSSTISAPSFIQNQEPNHPILNGMPAEFLMDDPMYQYTWNSTPGVSILATEYGYNFKNVIAEDIAGEGSAIYLGYFYNSVTENNSKILSNTLNYFFDSTESTWFDLTGLDSATVISPGDSLVMEINIPASEFDAGIYTEDFTIWVNNQNAAPISITLNLEVLGTASLAVEEDFIDFGQLIAGFETTDTLLVYNNGCEDLNITASVDEPQFAVNISEFTVPPYQQDTLLVTFSSEIAGVYAGELTLNSNGGTEIISLNGEILPPPVFSISPTDTVHIEIDCGGVAEETFSVYNSGETALNIEFETPFSDVFNVDVLTLFTEADQSSVEGMMEYLGQQVQNVTFHTSLAISNADLQEDLEGMDVFLIPRQWPTPGYDDLAPALTEFVEQGGRLLMCGQYYFNQTGFFDYVDQDLVNDDDDPIFNELPTHPIMSGIPVETFTADLVYYYDLGETTDILPLFSRASNPEYLGGWLQQIDLGTILYVGFSYSEDFDNSDTQAKHILRNGLQYFVNSYAPDWFESLSVDSIVTVDPGDSLSIDVSINGEGLGAGDYYYTSSVYTNDPDNILSDYVFHLQVTGEAELWVDPDTILYDPLVTGFTEQDTIVVKNLECDSLFLNTSLGNSHFSVSPDQLALPGYGQDTLFVTFQPTSAGVHSATLGLTSNGGDHDIYLEGEGLLAPEYSATVYDTLHFEMDCAMLEDSTSFTVYNNGPVDLAVDLNSVPTIENTINILALYPFSDTTEPHYINTLEAVDQSFSDYQIFSSNATDSDDLTPDLNNNDIHIVLIPYQEESPDWSDWGGISDALVQFVENGGSVLVCGNEDFHQTDLFPAAYDIDYADHGLVNVNPDHPVMYEIPDDFIGYGDFNFYSWDEDEVDVKLFRSVQYSNRSAGAVFQKGLGTVVYIGSFYTALNDHILQLTGNALHYLEEAFYEPEWIGTLSFNNPEIIGPGDSLVFQIDFSTEGMDAGDYYFSYIQSANDADIDDTEFVVHLDVNGIAILEHSAEIIDYGVLMATTTKTDTFIVSNDGCEPLLLDASVQTAAYQVSPTQLTIEPYSSDSLFITFQPEVQGNFTDTLELVSNGGNSEVVLVGEANPAPDIQVIENNFFVSPTGCPDSVSIQVPILNQGVGNLHFGISQVRDERNLDVVLNELANRYDAITDHIPQIHNFGGGHTGSHLDSFDGELYNSEGNRLRTNYQSVISYSNSQVVENAYVGINDYFTVKKPGIFSMVAELDGIEFFRINGNPDNTGDVNETEFSYTMPSGKVFKGYVSRYFDRWNAPTINRILIVEHDPEIEYFTYPPDPEYIDLMNLENTTRLYFVLFSSVHGSYVGDAEMQAVFEEYIQVVTTNFAEVANQYTLTTGETEFAEVTIPVTGYSAGTHQLELFVVSNDPDQPVSTIYVTLNIGDNVCASFDYHEPEGCSTTYEFENSSTNGANSFFWDFGDGNSSTDQHPIHTFQEPGQYDVSLEACLGEECDISVQTIVVNEQQGPSEPTCFPYTYTVNSNYHIHFVSMNGVENESEGIAGGYEDFTCLPPFTVTEGAEEDIQIWTNGVIGTFDIKVWIDLNNDAIFVEDEMVMSEETNWQEFAGTFEVPQATVVNTPVRMRIVYDDGVNDPCEQMFRGEGEDYSVFISPDSIPPSAQYQWDVLDACNGEVQFNDISTGAADSWLWQFGDGTTSTEQNPLHVFESGGEKTVQFIASNEFGSDSLEVTINLPFQGFDGINILSPLVANQTMMFEVPSNGVETWEWDFNGDVFTTQSPEIDYTYSSMGYKTISVSTTDSVCVNAVDTAFWITQFVSVIAWPNGENVEIFPNPARDEINIKLPTGILIEEIKIYDTSGRLLTPVSIHTTTDRMTLDMSNFSAGAYYLHLVSDGGLVTASRIVIQ